MRIRQLTRAIPLLGLMLALVACGDDDSPDDDSMVDASVHVPDASVFATRDGDVPVDIDSGTDGRWSDSHITQEPTITPICERSVQADDACLVCIHAHHCVTFVVFGAALSSSFYDDGGVPRESAEYDGVRDELPCIQDCFSASMDGGVGSSEQRLLACGTQCAERISAERDYNPQSTQAAIDKMAAFLTDVLSTTEDVDAGTDDGGASGEPICAATCFPGF
jgi:hypothetical protein